MLKLQPARACSSERRFRGKIKAASERREPSTNLHLSCSQLNVQEEKIEREGN
jgi:hypothetical protein